MRFFLLLLFISPVIPISSGRSGKHRGGFGGGYRRDDKRFDNSKYEETSKETSKEACSLYSADKKRISSLSIRIQKTDTVVVKGGSGSGEYSGGGESESNSDYELTEAKCVVSMRSKKSRESICFYYGEDDTFASIKNEDGKSCNDVYKLTSSKEKYKYVYKTTSPAPTTTPPPTTKDTRSNPYAVALVVCILVAVGGGLAMLLMFIRGYQISRRIKELDDRILELEKEYYDDSDDDDQEKDDGDGKERGNEVSKGDKVIAEKEGSTDTQAGAKQPDEAEVSNPQESKNKEKKKKKKRRELTEKEKREIEVEEMRYIQMRDFGLIRYK